ncbi:uncharacterized protein LOC133317851 [Gastrolobium bilobum]|uniref:uncharacterized protein LOC133317851 n=1 Tax=Gastrolobium bilobum TaxID=150636 RepID=UPI002AB1C157|nr:uncharacterized protein LOC133317851 [Gastrolobium bilobum]
MERRSLWSDLDDLCPLNNDPWNIIGDFNTVLASAEKVGGSDICWRSVLDFKQCLLSCILSDIGFKGPSFTWRRGHLQERLDRSCANESWNLAWPNSILTHLPFFCSDHRPMLLVNKPQSLVPRLSKPFRFLAGGGYYRKTLVILLAVVGRQMSAGTKLGALLSIMFPIGIDELVWYQRSRCNWLKYGDKNTKFFHASTISRRRINKILALKNIEGCWVSDAEELINLATSYFISLYAEDIGVRRAFPLSNMFPTIEPHVNLSLSLVPDDIEIRRVVFSMGKLKAPSSDGIHALFLQTQWKSVRDSICTLIRSFFSDPNRIEEVNQTLICFIPKTECPDSISNFRLISLCNVSYKILTKLLANRLKDFMPSWISPNQCSFISGRHGSDNVIIAQEVVHSMKKRKCAKGWMAIKLDLEKAYDRLNWQFIHDTLIDLGLPDILIRLIDSCVSSSTMNLLWNGNTTGDFKLSKGIRQGDPLSPYLFVLCVERVGHLINSASQAGSWKPIALGSIPGMLSLAGRVTLASLVLTALPTYSMQTSVLPALICHDLEKHTRSFVWGSSASRRRVHLVNWEKLCSPKEEGGLNLRSLCSFNKAFVMKLGHGLLTNSDALWVHVLRNKYGVGEDLITFLSIRSNVSNLWRGITKSWGDIQAGSRILIGDGINTKFWTDRWLPNLALLESKACAPIPDDFMDWKVADASTNSGSWD